MPSENSWGAVGKTETRNSKARDTGYVAGFALVHRRIILSAINKLELLFERHLAKEFVYARVPGDNRDRLCKRGRAQKNNCDCGAQ